MQRKEKLNFTERKVYCIVDFVYALNDLNVIHNKTLCYNREMGKLFLINKCRF